MNSDRKFRPSEQNPAISRTVVAIDLGAESCRVSLVTATADGGTVEVIHRFANGPIQRNGHLYWDIRKIVSEVEEGLRRCAAAAKGRIDSIGIDGWAVDYVRLDANGKPLGNPFCYRDKRTIKRQPQLWRRISRSRIYELTGIQMLRFNTIYQLFADLRDGVDPPALWVNIPEFVLHQLGGRPVAEYTNATHTQLVEAGHPRWSRALFSAAELPRDSAPEIVSPGTVIGKLSGSLSQLPAFKNTVLIAPACHDTGSAVAGIPAQGDDWAFLISGTWSLLGTVLPTVCTGRKALRSNFSNEGGLGGQVRFLKNVNGMWLLQQCLDQWRSQGRPWDISDLIDACSQLPRPVARLDVDDPDLLLPGNMIRRMNRVLAKKRQPGIVDSAECAPEAANLIFYSLAARYGQVVRDLAAITGKRFRRLYVVGGASRNEYLNRLVGETTRLEIIRGPVEASTVGNAAIQLAVLDGHSDEVSGVAPEAVAAWSQRITETFTFVQAQPMRRPAVAGSTGS